MFQLSRPSITTALYAPPARCCATAAPASNASTAPRCLRSRIRVTATVASPPLRWLSRLGRTARWEPGSGASTGFIVMSKFAQGIMTEAGLPAEQITIKPHFVPSPARVREGPGSYGLYLGRLSVEKGVSTLIESWDPSLGTLMIAGDGPLRRELEEQAAGHGNSVRFLGSLDRSAALELLLNARYLVNSSRAFETFGLSVVEAFAHGVPAVVPNQGVFPELFEMERTASPSSPGIRCPCAGRCRKLIILRSLYSPVQ